MGGCDFSFLEGGDCYLGEGTTSLATGEENTLLSHSVGCEDWGYVVEVSDHMKLKWRVYEGHLVRN